MRTPVARSRCGSTEMTASSKPHENDELTGWSKMPAWSMTKGVVSMIAGRAYTLGKLDLDACIGKYLNGLNREAAEDHGAKPAHAVIWDAFAWANDLNDASQFDSVQRLFERPFEAEPGTEFIYAQTTVTAVVAVVEAAVGEDFPELRRQRSSSPSGSQPTSGPGHTMAGVAHRDSLSWI